VELFVRIRLRYEDNFAIAAVVVVVMAAEIQIELHDPVLEMSSVSYKGYASLAAAPEKRVLYVSALVVLEKLLLNVNHTAGVTDWASA
jgi:hypothetical protein